MTTSHHADQFIIIGAGLAGLLTAYHLLALAKQHQRHITVTVLANDINVPCGAGSHIINEIDGFYASDTIPSQRLIQELRNGLQEMVALIEGKKIKCRLHLSYEIKCQNKDELNALISSAIDKKIFSSDELIDNSNDQFIYLANHHHSYHLKNAGQINAPEFLESLQTMIRSLGGNIMLGVQYDRHIKNNEDVYEISTNKGVFYTVNTPIIATGAEHQQIFIGNICGTKIIYTMCCVFQLPKSISKMPIAFCDTNLHDDVLWGSVDEQNFLTIGCGAETDKNAKERVQEKIQTIVRELFPDINMGNPVSVHWGATLHAPNMLPIVKRFPNYDIMGAWAGVGIVPAFVAGKAMAEWKLFQDEGRLRVFEELQSDII